MLLYLRTSLKPIVLGVVSDLIEPVKGVRGVGNVLIEKLFVFCDLSSWKGNLCLENDSIGQDKLRFDSLGGEVDLGRGVGDVTASKSDSILVVDRGI